MRWHAWPLLASVAVTAGFVACNLNPQPLPPENMASTSSGGDEGGSFRGDAEAEPTTPPPNPASDAGTGAQDGDGGEAGNADGGDGGDASDDDAG